MITKEKLKAVLASNPPRNIERIWFMDIKKYIAYIMLLFLALMLINPFVFGIIYACLLAFMFVFGVATWYVHRRRITKICRQLGIDIKTYNIIIKQL